LPANVGFSGFGSGRAAWRFSAFHALAAMSWSPSLRRHGRILVASWPRPRVANGGPAGVPGEPRCAHPTWPEGSSPALSTSRECGSPHGATSGPGAVLRARGRAMRQLGVTSGGLFSAPDPVSRVTRPQATCLWAGRCWVSPAIRGRA
jgi:hypothetical protein